MPPEYICRVCGKGFALKRSLEAHSIIHSSEKPYKCRFCDFATRHLSSYNSHLEYHGRRSHGLCLYYAKRKKRPELIQVRLPAPFAGPREDNNDGAAHCYYCTFSHSCKSSVLRHLNVHMAPTLFCMICGARFQNMDKLKKHIGTHSSDEPYKCFFCNFTSKNADSMKAHRILHEEGAINRPAPKNPARTKKKKPNVVYSMVPWEGPRKNTGKFLCYHCDHANDNKCNLSVHVCRLHVPAEYFCQECDAGFARLSMLRSHLMVHWRQNELKCHLCGYATYQRSRINEHMAWHEKMAFQEANPLVFTCFHCGLTTDRKYKLGRHIIHHLPKQFLCNLCSYEGLTRQALRDHMKTHSKVKNIACEACDYKTAVYNDLVDHMRIQHDGLKPLACGFCGYRCTKKYQLKSHLLSHSSEGKFQCPHCPQKVKYMTSLRVHIKAVHEGKRLACTMCDYQTAYKSCLTAHVKNTHNKHELPKLTCQFCGYVCYRKSSLTWHERVHTGEKPYACDLCDYRTRTSNILKQHMMRHTGERPYKCEHCEYRGRSKSNVLRHSNAVHSTDRPFKCPFCPCTFKTKQTADTHELTHTGQKKVYYCPNCSFRTVAKISFDRHMIKFHSTFDPNRPKKSYGTFPNGRRKVTYSCPECSHRIACRPGLKRHMKIRHPGVKYEEF